MKLRVGLILLAAGLLSLNACGGGGGSDGGSSALDQLINDNTPTNPGTPGSPAVEQPGTLGDLVDLGDLVEPAGDHWYYTRAVKINDAGTVIGQSNAGSPTKEAFAWDPVSETMTPLGIHPGVYEDFYGQLGTAIVLTNPSPFIYSEAVDINSSGTIIGNSTTGLNWPEETEKRGFVWKNGTFTDLAPLPGEFIASDSGGGIFTITKFSEAVDINDHGEIVLTAEDPRGHHAYYWDGVSTHTVTLPKDDGTTFDVVVPGPYIPLGGIVGQDSEAVAINENGQTVVNSGGTAVFHDLNWGVVESLNHLPGTTRTEAVDINDSAYTNNDDIVDGHVIGNSGNGTLKIDDDSSVKGFFWDGGSMYPVDDLGGGSCVATDINNKDQVVGAATTRGWLIPCHSLAPRPDDQERRHPGPRNPRRCQQLCHGDQRGRPSGRLVRNRADVRGTGGRHTYPACLSLQQRENVRLGDSQLFLRLSLRPILPLQRSGVPQR